MSLRTQVTVVTYNERDKLEALLDEFPTQRSYDLLFVDDGSTDGSADIIESAGLPLVRHTTNRGVGAVIRSAIQHARGNGYDVIVIMAGNGKMRPGEIPELLKPIEQGRADYVQGSRYLKGGQSPNLPLFRKVMIRLFTLVVNLFSGYRGTDVTCGFRAYRLDVIDRTEANLDQDWLDEYEMEYYIHYHVLKSGLQIVEVPVSMVYPKQRRNYSKIRPFVGWWSMIRPWIFLHLRIRK